MRGDQVMELCAGNGKDRLACQPGATRTVHQDVDAAEFAYARVDQGSGDVSVGRRPRMCDRAVDAICRLGGGLGVAPVDDDARALFGEEFGDCAADAPGSADDDGGTSGQRATNRRRPP
jgi:hypothetical protein